MDTIHCPHRFSSLLLFFFAICVSLTGAESPVKFRVGLTSLSFHPDSSGSEHYARSIPLLVYRQLSQITERDVPDGERLIFAKIRDSKKRTDQVTAFAEKRKKRDENLLFLPDPFYKFSTKIKTDPGINPSSLSQDPNSAPDDTASMGEPVEFWRDHTLGFIIPLAKTSVLPEIARKFSLDLVISGSIRESSGAFFLEIRAFNAIQEKETLFYETVFSLDSIEQAIDDIADALCEAISGHPPARLTVETGQPGTRIFIDDRLYGIGSADPRFLRPGKHSVTITSLEFENESRIVDIQAGEPGSLYFEMTGKKKREVEILTIPESASIYNGIKTDGSSPCILEFTEDIRTCSAIFEDGTTVFFTVYPSRMDSITVMKPDSSAMTFRTAKDRFYESLGFFMVSTIATSISSGIFQLYYNNAAFVEYAYADGLINEDMREKAKGEMEDRYYAWQYASLGCTAVTGGFLVLAGFRLAEYIDTAKR